MQHYAAATRAHTTTIQESFARFLTTCSLKDCGWPYPDSKLRHTPVDLKATNEHIQSALLHCPQNWDVKKARFSFALSPGYQESLVRSHIRHRSPAALPQLYCVPGTPSL